MNNKNAFCLITIKPNIMWLDFLKTMTENYDIYVIIDDNSFSDIKLIKKYNTIFFIRINDELCKKNGYWDSSFIIKKNPSGWDKALFYFSIFNIKYKNIWFCEDDVFFYNMNTILNIDNKYPDSDIICSNITRNNQGYKHDWHWQQALPYFKLPWLKTMVCCCRLSNRLMFEICRFVLVFEKLTFIECLFTTIAHHEKMSIETPEEFKNIHWRNDWKNFILDKSSLYHPFKNVEDHVSLRNQEIIISINTDRETDKKCHTKSDWPLKL
uniref:Nucleotide-diphospho-sugar transferase domain-containing protein n=1 Tax=viral metagenome TaxID=1070528 RepID=A0A6C0HSH5_9ZZZZ